MIEAPSRHSGARGFSLIELVITLVVLAIIAGLAAPSFRSLLVTQQVRNASFDLSSALLYARDEAVKRNTNVTIQATANAADAWHGGWQVTFVDASSTTRELVNQRAYNDIVITGDAASVVFNQAGRIAGGGALGFTLTSANGVAPITRCLRIDAGGRVNPTC